MTQNKELVQIFKSEKDDYWFRQVFFNIATMKFTLS